jgi:hypothetical protein
VEQGDEDGVVAEKWRRCDRCRKVKPVEEYPQDAAQCQACDAPAARATSRAGSAVTTTRVAPAAGAMVRTAAMSDLRGRGDHEVRARRARVRALDRLVEQYPVEFEVLLADERRSEGL